MQIGSLQIPSRVLLAPMAGVTDHIYRVICREHSAGLVYTEFVSSNGIIRENERTLEMLHFEERERPIGIQIFGDDADILAESAAFLEETLQPDLIDLNFGCPVPKVTKKGAGSAILKDQKKVGEVCEKVVNAVNLPVTVKMRSGWSAKEIVAPEYAQLMESVGIQAVAVHGRTTQIRYEKPSDNSVIADTKEAVDIPVIGNGDIMKPEDAQEMIDETGCDGVMIARGALGNPWILHRTHHYLETGELLPEPTYEDRLNLCLRHIHLKEEEKDSTLAAMLMKKNIGWYLKGMPNASNIRHAINTSDETDQMYTILEEYARELEIPVSKEQSVPA
ncbi:MAG: tRNA dihydrouridine synthase DusB [Candidatus Marinimicrobia bacterium]|nr:tRNA dihydrouridine synthase DusB [Candidatus Neomarinimicrobiota bacterium]MCF7829634.1 tRNA dihydrouridine synthase DusB [Candidatus Neomarinimicrobiota bacterium]MCF7879794.1 tRNA dihydrouridine synthase DusB [Candidatus Neomarinimicrobiota bacterium]